MSGIGWKSGHCLLDLSSRARSRGIYVFSSPLTPNTTLLKDLFRRFMLTIKNVWMTVNPRLPHSPTFRALPSSAIFQCAPPSSDDATLKTSVLSSVNSFVVRIIVVLPLASKLDSYVHKLPLIVIPPLEGFAPGSASVV